MADYYNQDYDFDEWGWVDIEIHPKIHHIRIPQVRTKFQNNAKFWRNELGILIHPSKMDNSYLLNCLHLCERNHANRSEAFPKIYTLLNKEAKRRRLINR